MSKMRDRFETRVERFAQLQREFNKRLEDFERRAAKKPFLCAEEAWADTQGMVGVLRKQSIDLFGLDVKHYGPLIRSAALEPAEEEPESWEDITPFCGSIEACAFAVFFVSLYMDYEMTFMVMKSAYRRPDIWGVSVAECVCELYAQMLRERPRRMFAAIETVQQKFPRVARREALAEALSGYFVTQLSSKPEYRMGRALLSEKSVEETLHQALLRELPAEALAAWAERGRKELKELKEQISGRIERLGPESLFKEKLADLPAGMPEKEEADVLLEEFEHQETLRQEVEQLKGWVESAKFSGREEQMYELDMRTNFDTAAAAHEMGVSEKKARDYRSRYLAKLKQASGL